MSIPASGSGPCCSVRIDKSEPCAVRGICQSPASGSGPCCSARIDKSEPIR
ncbi:hypothetical protein QUF80_21080 [Desulfococcaceae bacterium HSG8]|nr:hypothetical protein [Desulfococcaceae bacterium HSG8]